MIAHHLGLKNLYNSTGAKAPLTRARRRIDMNVTWEKAYNEAIDLVVEFPEMELTSALKQFGFNHGINEGDDMAKFVKWGWDKMLQMYADFERK
jgi:hypothetical protein